MTGVNSSTSIACDNFCPAVFDVFDRRHVGHRAAGGQVGQHDRRAPAAAGGELFRAIGEDVGRLGHEVDAAEDDRPAFGVGGRQRAELVAVAAEVRQGNDVVLLVVMAEDQEPSAHVAADLLDAGSQFAAVQGFVRAEIVAVGVDGPIPGSATYSARASPGRETWGHWPQGAMSAPVGIGSGGVEGHQAQRRQPGQFQDHGRGEQPGPLPRWAAVRSENTGRAGATRLGSAARRIRLLLCCGPKLKSLPKRGVEVVDVVEILPPVLGRLSHLPDADQVEDHLAEVAGGADAPLIQHRLGHVAVLFQGETANRLAQLLPGDVPTAEVFLLHVFAGQVARLRFLRAVALAGPLLFFFAFLERRIERFALAFDAEAEDILGVIEGLEDEDVGFPRIAAVVAEQFANRGIKHDCRSRGRRRGRSAGRRPAKEPRSARSPGGASLCACS